MANLFEHERIRQELQQGLAAYFKLTPQEQGVAYTDMLTSLEAEAIMLQKYTQNRDNPNYQYALRSIVTVAARIKSKFMLDICQRLNSDIPDEELLNTVNLFLQIIQQLRKSTM